MSSHSELWRISSRSSVRSTLPACSTYVRALASISSPVRHGPRGRAAARVPDARGVVADDQHDRVAGVLELAQLLEHHGVAEVDVGGGRVEPELDAQRAALGEPPLECPGGQAIDRISGQVGGQARRRIRPSGPMLEWPPGRRRARERGTRGPVAPFYGLRAHLQLGRRRRRQRVAGDPAAPRVRQRRRAAGRLAAHPQAARDRAAGGPRPARGRLDGVRDDDGRRVRPAGARGAVRPELGDRRPPRRAARPPDRQPSGGSSSPRTRSRRR